MGYPQNNRLTRLIRAAGYPYTDVSMEDIEYHPDRGLDGHYSQGLAPEHMSEKSIV